MQKQLLIFGSGSIAELAHFYFTQDSQYHVAGFTVDAAYLNQTTFHHLPVVAWEDAPAAFPPSQFEIFIAISYAQLNRLRTLKLAEAEAKGYRVAHYVSSKATIFPDFTPRPNQFILENNTIQPYYRIGKNVTLWSGNHIGHHSNIADNCFISSHVVISGHVTVAENSFIGVNATIRDNITIGRDCIIGAGAVIMQNTGDNALYATTATEKSKIPASRIKRI